MKVLIIEDESGVAQNLCDLLQEIEQGIEILAIIESVKEAVEWFENNPKPELGFFDIRLADGDSFEIFEKVKIDFPVIFTTAYDEYALRAFKVNSIDYLLKPIDKDSLLVSLDKYNSIYKKNDRIDNETLLKIIKDLRHTDQKKYKRSFLVYIKDKILPIAVEDIAYFYLENELVFCITHKNEKYVIDQYLDKISSQTNPEDFFRANRQYIVSRKAVRAAVNFFHRKLKLNLSPSPPNDVFISKTKAAIFKKWLEM